MLGLLTHHRQHQCEMQAPVDQDLAAQQPVAPAKMRVPQLKEQLKTFNMPVSGKKADLVHRLETALAAVAASGHASAAASPVTEPASAVSQEAEPAAASPSGHAAPPSAASESAETRGAGHSPLSPTHTVGSNATASQQSMTSLEVAALNEDEEQEPNTAVGCNGEAEVQQSVAGVQPGTEGLGDVATFEVRACPRASVLLCTLQQISAVYECANIVTCCANVSQRHSIVTCKFVSLTAGKVHMLLLCIGFLSVLLTRSCTCIVDLHVKIVELISDCHVTGRTECRCTVSDLRRMLLGKRLLLGRAVMLSMLLRRTT